MLFNFTLAPLESVEPWGKPGQETLHWFGLTDGEYWIEAGNHALLEHSEGVCATYGWPRHCEYQIARLYEDLADILPYVLEPLPAALLGYLSNDAGRIWRTTCEKWSDRLEGREKNDAAWGIAEAALTWLQRRRLDTLYMSSGAGIYMWSDTSNVFIGWDNVDSLYEGLPAWSATSGVFSFARESFLHEARAFQDRLMGQMEERVKLVLAGALPSHIHVDHPNLRQEQDERRRWIENAIAAPHPATDWSDVQNAILRIEREMEFDA